MLHRSGFGLLHQLLIAKHQQMCSHKPRTTETACCKSSLHRAASSPLCSAQMEGFGKKRYKGEEKLLNLHGWESSSTSALFPFSALRVCLCLPRATKLLFPCPAPYSDFFPGNYYNISKMQSWSANQGLPSPVSVAEPEGAVFMCRVQPHWQPTGERWKGSGREPTAQEPEGQGCRTGPWVPLCLSQGPGLPCVILIPQIPGSSSGCMQRLWGVKLAAALEVRAVLSPCASPLQ